MRVRYLNLIWLILAALISACDPHATGPSRGQSTFLDQEDPMDPPLLLEGKREYTDLAQNEIPAIVQERQGMQKPQSQDTLPTLRIGSPHLVIDVDTQTVTLNFEANSKRGIETVNLKGRFDRSTSPWKATLYSTDQKVLEERRVQAVFLCLSANYCDVVGVNIYYKVDGKIITKQLLDGVAGPRLAMSGDLEESAGELAGEDPNAVADPGNNRPVIQPTQPLALPAPTVPPSPSPSAPANPTAKPKLPDAVMPNGVLNQDPVVAPAEPSEISTVPLTPKVPASPTVNPAPSRVVIPMVKPPRTAIENLKPEELKDKAIEYHDDMNIGTPEKSKYRIEGLEEPKPINQNQGEPVQAIGAHDARFGRLERANYVPTQGPGFIRREAIANPNLSQNNDNSMAWGTLRMTKFIEQAGLNLSKDLPDSRLVLNAVSKKTGGPVPAQLSHRTGLDADLRYISVNNNGESFYAVSNGRLSKQLDVARTWEMMKSLCSARQEWVIVIFVDRVVKQAMCDQARQLGEPVKDEQSLTFQCLRSLYHSDGHQHHAHVRLYCPKTEGCQNTKIDLPPGTGCNFK